MKIIVAKMEPDHDIMTKKQSGFIPRVVYSTHPEYVTGTRFDYGFLQVALGQDYCVIILPNKESK